MAKDERQPYQGKVPEVHLTEITDQEEFIEKCHKNGWRFGDAEKTHTLIYHDRHGDEVIGIVLYDGASALSKARWKALINS